jgi:UDP:flavonoid glycosyltransferase YjiC (YdhE family)
VERSGARFVPWTTAPSRRSRTDRSDALRDWDAPSPAEGFAHALRTIMTGPALAYARDVLAELEREPADLVVSSEMLFGVMAACESVRQPLALFAANLCAFPLPGMPTFGPGLPPPRDAAERQQHAAIKEATMALIDSGLGELNAARAALGLAPLAHVIDQLDAAQALLLGTSQAFDFPVENRPAKLRYVGPQLAEPGWVAPWSAPWPATDRRPLVLVAFSTTFQNHASVVQSVLDAAARLPVRALVTLGGLEAHELRAPDNAWLVPSAPHGALLPQSAVVVTHGGHGTVMRSLSHRRPMLIIPHGRDQDDNAARVAARGAGLVLPVSSGTDEIHGALVRLLESPAFAEAAARLGAAIEAESKWVSAVAELETLAAVDPCSEEPRAGAAAALAGAARA